MMIEYFEIQVEGSWEFEAFSIMMDSRESIHALSDRKYVVSRHVYDRLKNNHIPFTLIRRAGTDTKLGLSE